jgi:hypothetical protein
MEHPHDAVQQLNKTQIQMIQLDVRSVVEDALLEKDPETAFRYGENLNRTGQAIWVAMAHLIYEMERKWGEDEDDDGPRFSSDDDFITVAASRWNKAETTIRRYLEIWKHVMEKPLHSDVRLGKLYTKPMQGLWYIKAAAKENQLTEADWQEIEDAPDIKTLWDIGRRVRGEVGGSARRALKIMIEKDGTLKARRQGVYKIIGHLNIHEEDDEIVVAACERIINKCGVFYR